MGHTGIGWRHAHYAQLLQLQPMLPFLEVHSENFFGAGGAALAVLTQARAHYPISLHGVGLGLGSACGIDAWHLAQLQRLVERIEPVRVSDHACFARTMVSDGPIVHGSDLLPLPFSRAALDVLASNVQQVQDALQRPIAVENLSAYIGFAENDFSEPEFLNALAARTGCQLLIDVNNIYVNALNTPRLRASAPMPATTSQASAPELASADSAEPLAACRAWLGAIAPQHVAELHLAGHCQREDGWVIDDHGSLVCEPVWQLYQHALGLWGAVPSLVEWDTDIPPLAVLLAQAARADAYAGAAQGQQQAQPAPHITQHMATA